MVDIDQINEDDFFSVAFMNDELRTGVRPSEVFLLYPRDELNEGGISERRSVEFRTNAVRAHVYHYGSARVRAVLERIQGGRTTLSSEDGRAAQMLLIEFLVKHTPNE
jgi:hypothetical protein